MERWDTEPTSDGFHFCHGAMLVSLHARMSESAFKKTPPSRSYSRPPDRVRVRVEEAEEELHFVLLLALGQFQPLLLRCIQCPRVDLEPMEVTSVDIGERMGLGLLRLRAAGPLR